MARSNRQYFFGVFITKDDQYQVGAFRHVKDRQLGAYCWRFYNHRYKKYISMEHPDDKKFKKWCSTIRDASVYELECDAVRSSNMNKRKTSKKGDRQQSGQ